MKYGISAMVQSLAHFCLHSSHFPSFLSFFLSFIYTLERAGFRIEVAGYSSKESMNFKLQLHTFTHLVCECVCESKCEVSKCLSE